MVVVTEPRGLEGCPNLLFGGVLLTDVTWDSGHPKAEPETRFPDFLREPY